MQHPLHVLTGCYVDACFSCVVCAQRGSMEPTDLEREGDLGHEDSEEKSCLAGVFARLLRLHRLPRRLRGEELSTRERLLVQESARAAAHAVAREAAEAATRALAPHVAQELARLVLRDVARTRHA